MTDRQLTESETEILITYFKELREEINNRVNTHTRLVWIKLLAMGTSASFLVSEFYGTNSQNSAFLFLLWLLPIGGFTFDILIASNLQGLRELGYYNRKYMEKQAFRHVKEPLPDSFGFWEETVAQSNTWTCYTPEDITMIWFLTLGGWMFAGFTRIQVTGGILTLTPGDALFGIGSLVGIIWGYRRMLRSIDLDAIDSKNGY